MNEPQKNQVLRLNRGDLLVKSLIDYAKEHKLTSAWINGLGAAKWTEIGFYELENKKYTWKKINKPLEILSLQGNIAWNNAEPVIHIHGVFSDDTMGAFGGHVKELEVAGTCEIKITMLEEQKIKREYDEETGLNLLNIGK